MDAYRALVSNRDTGKASSAMHKKGKDFEFRLFRSTHRWWFASDKLEQTKKRDAEIKAALKEVRDNKKHEKHEEQVATAHVHKLERLQEHPDSKRSQKDARHV